MAIAPAILVVPQAVVAAQEVQTLVALAEMVVVVVVAISIAVRSISHPQSERTISTQCAQTPNIIRTYICALNLRETSRLVTQNPHKWSCHRDPPLSNSRLNFSHCVRYLSQQRKHRQLRNSAHHSSQKCRYGQQHRSGSAALY